MRKLNYEGDYNLIFEKQRKYEEGLKSYHNDTHNEDHHLEEKENEQEENKKSPK